MHQEIYENWQTCISNIKFLQRNPSHASDCYKVKERLAALRVGDDRHAKVINAMSNERSNVQSKKFIVRSRKLHAPREIQESTHNAMLKVWRSEY